MKLFKKSIGIALAVIMLVNVFMISSFAQISYADKGIKMTFKSDKTSYQAGDTATFYVYLESSVDLAAGQFSISYNSNYLEPIIALTSAQATLADAGVIFSGYGFETTVDSSISFACDGSSMDPTISDSATYSLDSTIFLSMAANPSVFYDFSNGAIAFAIQMTVKANTGESYVNFNYDSFDSFNSYFTTELGDLYTSDASLFTSGTVDDMAPIQVVPCKFSVGQAGVDCNLDNNTKIRWSTDNSSNLVDLGFTGTIQGTDISKSGYIITSGLYEIGVIFSISDSNKAPTLADVDNVNVFSDTVGTVYEYDTNDDSVIDTWKFRAIAENVTYTSTQNIYAVMYIKISAAADPIYSQPTIITANYHYNRAVAANAGFSAFAG